MLPINSDTQIFSIAFSHDGEHVATASRDKAIMVFEAATGNQIARIDDHTNWVHCVAFNAEGMLLSAGLEETVRTYGAHCIAH